MTSQEIKDTIIDLLKEKKAADITVIDVEGQTSVTDYFVIATGRSTTQVKALTDFLDEKGEEKGLTAYRRDGVREGRWVVVDYGQVIVHIFNDAMRDFYNLEKLWGNANNTVHIDD
ncbi:MAG: ribosome silencing factor [Christensenellales bacterium]